MDFTEPGRGAARTCTRDHRRVGDETARGDPLAIWATWADDFTGHGIDSGHHVAEEAPDELTEVLAGFLTRAPR